MLLKSQRSEGQWFEPQCLQQPLPASPSFILHDPDIRRHQDWPPYFSYAGKLKAVGFLDKSWLRTKLEASGSMPLFKHIHPSTLAYLVWPQVTSIFPGWFPDLPQEWIATNSSSLCLAESTGGLHIGPMEPLLLAECQRHSPRGVKLPTDRIKWFEPATFGLQVRSSGNQPFHPYPASPFVT